MSKPTKAMMIWVIQYLFILVFHSPENNNPQNAELKFFFQSLEIVSRQRDPQFQLTENYLDWSDLIHICECHWFKTHHELVTRVLV